MDNSKVKVGVIGVGRMGLFHVNCYSEIREAEIVGVSDVDKVHGQAVADKFNIRYFPDYRELLDQVDVVSVAVPTGLHYKIGKEVLLSGTHAIIEKPITNSLPEAEDLFRIAREQGVVLHVGHVERFNGAVHELEKLVTEPVLIQSRRLGPFQPRVANDGVVMDLMIHDIDITLNLVKSELKTVNVMGRSVDSDRDDVVIVQMAFASGCLATITASRATHNKVRNMAITCRDKYLKLDFADQEIQVHSMAASEHQLRSAGDAGTSKELRYSEAEKRERIFVHRENPLKLELQHLINCVLGREDRKVSVEKELSSLRVALQILDQYRAFTEG